MRRVISIFLPHWAMECRKRRLRRSGTWQPDKPFVITSSEGQQQTVVALNRAAAACGIATGTSLSRARVVAPEVRNEAATPEEDAHMLRRLTLRALRYSPLVAPAPPDGLWIDATGCTHLFDGEAAMVRDIGQRLRAVGLTARTAMAGTPGAAWAWARYGRHDPILAPGAERETLDVLPLAALRLPAETLSALRHIVLRTIGELRALPRKTVPVRFGADVLLRLDQALGHAAEAITPIFPPAAKRRRLAFVEPIAAPEDLQRCIGVLCEQLCIDLDKSRQGARNLDLVFTRTDSATETIRIGLARPSRDPGHLSRLLGDKLTTIDPGFGIEAAVLTAWRVEGLQAAQLSTDGQQRETERDLGELVDRLAARVGENNVFRIAPKPSDIPERAAVRTNPMNIPKANWPARWPRPIRLLSPPEPITVIALLPDYPPAKFRWRNQMHTVRAADGPERVFGEWWKTESEVAGIRDYFRVENEEGERYWLFRSGYPDGAHQWFVHGVFA